MSNAKHALPLSKSSETAGANRPNTIEGTNAAILDLFRTGLTVQDIADLIRLDTAAVGRLVDGAKKAARSLAARGISPNDIAAILKISADQVRQLVADKDGP